MVFSLVLFFFFFKQKTSYELRISDWSSDVCSSDLGKALASSSGNGWVLSQVPDLAKIWAVASSIRLPCSMHCTPARLARWIDSGVEACTATYLPRSVADCIAALSSGRLEVTTSRGLCGDDAPPPAVSLIQRRSAAWRERRCPSGLVPG